MDIKSLKRFLFENPDKIKLVLEELHLHHIKLHKGSSSDDFYSCGNFDGDNQSAINIYLSESLLTINYTRTISPNKNNSDLLDLIMFCRQENLFESLKWVSETIGFDYYHSFKDDMPESLKILKQLKEMLKREESESDEDKTPIKQRPEVILSYYFPEVNDMFFEDGISYGTQIEFEIGYDAKTDRITIPIRNEIGDLVGVKGRLFSREVPENESKYSFLESCPKSKILYGYYKTKNYIKESKKVFVFESEKSVMSAWDGGYKNTVATMGKKISQYQIDNINRLGVDVILSFDKDVPIDELNDIAEKFMYGIKVYCLFDDKNIMKNKMSPCDDISIFRKLIDECLIELK